jgi:hypothetical protein
MGSDDVTARTGTADRKVGRYNVKLQAPHFPVGAAQHHSGNGGGQIR